MRKEKIFKQSWNDMDFNQLYIYIKKLKSNRTRKIPMNGVVLADLKSIKSEGEFLFMSQKTGTRLAPVFRSFKAACEKAKISDLRFHDLRHTAATLIVMGGVDLVTVKEILGHSKIEMTMRYAYPTAENKRRAVNVLASVFEEKKHGTKQAQEQNGKPLTPLKSGGKN